MTWTSEIEPVAYTRAQLEQIAPKPYRVELVSVWDSFLNALTSEDGRRFMAEYGISKSPRRLAHFIAQTAHESAGFTRFEENLAYSAERLMQVFGKRYFASLREARKCEFNSEAIANIVYDDANRSSKLGNTEPGDGWKYRGRGPIQITGRDAYERFSRWLGEDFILAPDLLLQPLVGLQAALWFWQLKNLNAHADADRIGRITKLVNGGYAGIEERRRLYETAQSLWCEYHYPTAIHDLAMLQEGSDGPEVEALQRRLRELHYPVGDIDGRFGEQTHIALVAFQELSGLKPDGVYGPQTRKVMRDAKPRNLGARAEVTESDLKKKSKTVRQVGFLHWLASGAAALFGLDGATESGLIGPLKAVGDKAAETKGALDNIIPFLDFAARNIAWVLALAIALGLWWATRNLMKERIEHYRTGANLEG